MASRFDQRRAGKHLDYLDSYLLRDHSPSPLNEPSHSASSWAEEQGDSLREQLKDMDEHVTRIQDMLKCEQAKCAHLQQRCNQQEAELRRREQHSSRLRERLSQLPDREKGPSIEVLNCLPGGRGKREQPVKAFRSTAKQEEAMLRVMLERREAELREAMKLRHSLTTLLHALRVDMEHTLLNVGKIQNEAQTKDKKLDQAEVALGDHVTGGVVQIWRQVQGRMGHVPSEGHTGSGSEQEKLLARMETELTESQQLVRLQQQLLQDGLASSVPTDLTDSYFLEEWERLQVHWTELDHQRRTFERERQSFTDAAIRLSHERCDFENTKASLLKQQYLCDSPRFNKGAAIKSRRDSSALNFSGLGFTSLSGCVPITPSSTKSGVAAVPGSDHRRTKVLTPSTPELYSALNLYYTERTGEESHQSETCAGPASGRDLTPKAQLLDWSF